MDLQRLTGPPNAAAKAAASEVYAAAFAKPPYLESPEEISELHGRLDRYSLRAGYRLTLATAEGAPLGMAMSVHAREGDWWRDMAAAALPVAARREWFSGVIREVVHVAVAPDRQRQGVGRGLVDDALDDDEAAAVVLSCRPDAEAAQRLYLNCGFEVLTADFRTSPEQMPYWLMARRPNR